MSDIVDRIKRGEKVARPELISERARLRDLYGGLIGGLYRSILASEIAIIQGAIAGVPYKSPGNVDKNTSP